MTTTAANSENIGPADETPMRRAWRRLVRRRE